MHYGLGSLDGDCLIGATPLRQDGSVYCVDRVSVVKSKRSAGQTGVPKSSGIIKERKIKIKNEKEEKSEKIEGVTIRIDDKTNANTSKTITATASAHPYYSGRL